MGDPELLSTEFLKPTSRMPYIGCRIAYIGLRSASEERQMPEAGSSCGALKLSAPATQQLKRTPAPAKEKETCEANPSTERTLRASSLCRDEVQEHSVESERTRARTGTGARALDKGGLSAALSSTRLLSHRLSAKRSSAIPCHTVWKGYSGQRYRRQADSQAGF